ncbi:UNVERIFIED_CONTAM: hypothetical protein K2H54_073523 [Gekko kuhli]
MVVAAPGPSGFKHYCCGCLLKMQEKMSHMQELDSASQLNLKPEYEGSKQEVVLARNVWGWHWVPPLAPNSAMGPLPPPREACCLQRLLARKQRHSGLDGWEKSWAGCKKLVATPRLGDDVLLKGIGLTIPFLPPPNFFFNLEE